MEYEIGVDLGGTKLLIALADARGKIIQERQTASDLYGSKWFNILIRGINAIVKENNLSMSDVSAIGIGSPQIKIRFMDKQYNLRDVLKVFLEQKLKKNVLV